MVLKMLKKNACFLKKKSVLNIICLFCLKKQDKIKNWIFFH